MDTWKEWSAKVISFSKVESASCPYIKKILVELEKADKFTYPEGSQFKVFKNYYNFSLQIIKTLSALSYLPVYCFLEV